MRTLELVSGSRPQRWSYSVDRARSAPAALWLRRGDPPRPWEGLRQILAHLEPVAGSATLRDVLGRHPAAAHLLLAGSRFAPPAPETPRPEFPSRLESHLTHNSLLKRPFLTECVEMLTALFAASDAWLVAPDLADVDSETVWLLDRFFQWRPEAFPSAVLGFEPDAERDRPDARGIVWGSFQIHLSSFVFNLARQPEAQRIEAPESPASPGALDGEKDKDDEDDDLRCLRAFESADETSPELRDSMLDLVRRAFAAHAFEASLRWGLRLLDRDLDLDPADDAELRNLVALSAHNRQFRSGGNERLAPVLEDLLREALSKETRPAWKSALGYRMAVTLGRRQSRLEAARQAAGDALDVAQSPDVHPVVSRYLQAWALNIRAFLHMRLGRMDRAVDDTERALRMLQDVRDGWSGEAPEIRAAWERNVLLSWSILVSNRIALAEIGRDVDALQRWRRRNEALLDDYPEFELYELAGQLHSHRIFLRFDLALERARRGCEVARRERNTLWEYQLLAQRADLAFRLGRLDEAVEACEAARTFRRDYANPGVLGSLDLLHAEALGRAGRTAAARDLLDEVLREPGASPVRRIEAHALAARLAALAGHEEEAEECANRAIDEAVEHGSRDGLVLAAVAAGTASRELGRSDEARDAYTRALEIAATGEPDEPPPPAGDVLEAHLGLDSVLEALRLLPEALQEPRTWWLLQPLATAVKRVRRREPARLEDPEWTEPLELLQLTSPQVR